ncbi:hypothetical protein PSN45_003769 [Yamadazyma tenuis]|uniref:SPX domain-containing protein n=1 Tax=Candida tenuis (strain ATCC 10573 / BCRC 21748 / CBS 615 / JCM 9827 / NBRC 10315 / NRRL Y-1498 / VKM Y-70) TaxID=590646 RepID=G3B3B8_CANTC|nr:uncharacterized protein CANTEDRAFT_104690 [Yamadazyma tenuis ATCC 10573]EGV64131.1 hypothetical protein CANTEDRAFT_104690 [Yamadazyma tenuis ATCC 10573]WEJ96233.1 hypothetical protein PSN45_003769 [Yamadazyma tenuis]
MKFGKSLIELTIPEWKSYNLDYNDLKSQIRLVSESQVSLASLNRKFLSNFEVINMFVKTKHADISRKLEHYDNSFDALLENDDGANVKLIKMDMLVSSLIDLSITLKKLSKFILIQKIAVKKIFKKLSKKHPDPYVSSKIIFNLKLVLNRDRQSFVNISLVDLTLRLTNMINLIKFEMNKLRHKDQELEQDPMFSEGDGKLTNLKFDFNVLLKKNFSLTFILPDDSSNFNEVLLNMNIYLSFQRLSEKESTNSIIFLQNDENLSSQPSYVLSELGETYSLIISHIGGLRKFSYCYLPNNIIDSMFKYLHNSNNEECEEELKEYFRTHTVNSLTKLTIDSLLNKNLKPKVKVYTKTLRYYIDKYSSVQPDNSGLLSEPLQDDYLLNLRYDICTTNAVGQINTTDFNVDDPDLDKFPFNLLELNSNDSNLLRFEKTLLTEIKDDNQLVNKFSIGHLGKLPDPIQKLIKNNNSINLFRNFNLYQYTLSSYYNVVPQDINNHFSKLLNMNLFKSFENIENFNNDLSFDSYILKDNTDKMLKNQLSLNDLEHQAKLSKQKQSKASKASSQYSSRPNLKKNSSLQSMSSSFNLSVFTNDKSRPNEFDDLIEDEDNDSLRIFWNEEPEARFKRSNSNSNLSNFVLNLIHLKSRMNRVGETTSLRGSNDYINDYQSVSVNSNSNQSVDYYTTLNHYYYEHDKILSFFYLTLSFSSIFIASVEFGLTFSILKLQQTNQFQVNDNMWFFGILSIGIIISFICSMLAFNLIFKRFSAPSCLHYGVIVISFALILLCIILCALLFFL